MAKFKLGEDKSPEGPRRAETVLSLGLRNHLQALWGRGASCQHPRSTRSHRPHTRPHTRTCAPTHMHKHAYGHTNTRAHTYVLFCPLGQTSQSKGPQAQGPGAPSSPSRAKRWVGEGAGLAGLQSPHLGPAWNRATSLPGRGNHAEQTRLRGAKRFVPPRRWLAGPAGSRVLLVPADPQPPSHGLSQFRLVTIGHFGPKDSASQKKTDSHVTEIIPFLFAMRKY